CMAGFADDLRRQPGGWTAIPAAFRYAPAVSRRTPVSSSIRRSGQPSFPSAMTCCFFSSLKTLLMAARLSSPWLMSGASFIGRFSGGLHMAGFEVATHGRFWVAADAERLKSRFTTRLAHYRSQRPPTDFAEQAKS